MIATKMEPYIKGSSMIRAMFEDSIKMAEKFGADNVFDFSLGNPCFPPPPEVRESILKHIDDPDQVSVHGYGNNSGHAEVRTKIAESLNRRFKAGLGSDNILMCTGAAGGINVILKTLIDPGDEIITFAPFFGEYKNYAAAYEAELMICPPLPPDFKPNTEALKDLITEKTKAVIINSPNNPTGVVYSEDDIRKIAETLSERQNYFGKDIYIISDEPYRDLVYSGAEAPWIPNHYDNTVVVYSYSKALSLAGERIGYIAVSPKVSDSENILAAAKEMTRILGFVHAPSLFQLVAGDCVDVPVDVSAYRKNRDRLYNELTAIGYKCVPPDGAFYLFVKTPEPDDLEFSKRAKEYQLCVVPGSVFGCGGYIRLAYCVAYDKIERSIPKFLELYNSYRK